jgi:hypothetical protein
MVEGDREEIREEEGDGRENQLSIEGRKPWRRR